MESTQYFLELYSGNLKLPSIGVLGRVSSNDIFMIDIILDTLSKTQYINGNRRMTLPGR